MDHYPQDAQPAQRAAFLAAQPTHSPLFPAHSLFAATRAAITTLLAALLGLGAVPAHAGNGPPLAWACWLSEQIPASIKCIHDRGMMRQGAIDDEKAVLRRLRPDVDDISGNEPGQMPQGWQQLPGDDSSKFLVFPGRRSLSQLIEQDEPENEIEAEVLNEIYSKILMGDTTRLDNLVERHMGSLRENSILTINIYTPPLDASWRENQPVKIVRSALCPKKPNCRVILNKPDY